MARFSSLIKSCIWVGAALLITAAVVVGVTDPWRSGLLGAIGFARSPDDSDASSAHAAHDSTEKTKPVFLAFCDATLENIGITEQHIQAVCLRDYEQTVAFPAIVVERPGRSTVKVSAPLTGAVERIYREEGEAVAAQQPLFDIRLNEEALLQSQAEFLSTSRKLETARAEVERLTGLAAEGLALNDLLLQKYGQNELLAAYNAQKQLLQLHGLPLEGINRLETDPENPLVEMRTVGAPEVYGDRARSVSAAHLQLQLLEMCVVRGQQVTVGDTLCLVSDYSELRIEASAFETDSEMVNHAVENKREVVAVFQGHDGHEERVTGLRIRYVDDRIDRESRKLCFYVPLENSLLRDEESEERHYIGWRFKPGQRCRLELPTTTIRGQIVLPVAAVADDGLESVVFRLNGKKDGNKKWDRISVHVLHRDRDFVVIASDNGIDSSDYVAMAGAGQLQAELNRGGGLVPTCDCGKVH